MNILFVCTGNTCRSAMAEEIARILIGKLGMEDVHVSSAGVFAMEGTPASIGAQMAVMEIGGDLTGHLASQLTQARAQAADLILCMEGCHLQAVRQMGISKEKSMTLLGFADDSPGNIADPFGGDSQVYHDCMVQIGDAVRKALERIKAQG